MLNNVFQNWTGWTTVKTILTAVSVASLAVAHAANLPTVVQGVASTVAQVDSAVLAVVVFLSGTAASSPALAKLYLRKNKAVGQ